MTPRLIHHPDEGREACLLSITRPARHWVSIPGERETVFSVLSLCWYANDKGFHLFRVKDSRCPAGFPDRSMFGVTVCDNVLVIELMYLKISIE